MLLDKKTYFVKEQVELMKLAGTYDIYDAETNIQVGIAKEEPGTMIKFLRLLVNKSILPNRINVYDSENQSLVFYIQKPMSFLRSKVFVYNSNGDHIGYFKGKILTIGGGFFVYDSNEREVAEIIGDWKGWNFRFVNSQEKEIGTVTKKWAGIGKELFTSADNYVISLNDAAESESEHNKLLLAAGLAIDTVYKEHK
ncbi:uncharacterized protein YxjI [Anaerosolibacter carboniphilus]|uniref:Uncharacterized protein YxjI n=1 Tax=Anaerosolibacter carboniphilus TaxID=1417629 RepID=A0A841KSM8_9FIRM|nr:phospholipid scramblase-related protein [Anaerosolibacter carboniphilus]MBB6216586.1 uncharacterized protein YxjI [Anaerosolibacter carboniphilus]